MPHFWTQNNKKDEVIEIYEKIEQTLFTMIKKSIDNLEKAQTIDYLLVDYCRLVNDLCKSDNYEWRIWVSPQGDLWKRVEMEVHRLLSKTICFMAKQFRIPDLPIERMLAQSMR
jgi:hypothetical protein